MIFSTIKSCLAAHLHRAADAISPAPTPVILPAEHLVPTDPVERAKLFERFTVNSD